MNLYDFQNGKCGACNEPNIYVDLVVDHCHQTGIVRGLLCRSCNRNEGNRGNAVAYGRLIPYLDNPPALQAGCFILYDGEKSIINLRPFSCCIFCRDFDRIELNQQLHDAQRAASIRLAAIMDGMNAEIQ